MEPRLVLGRCGMGRADMRSMPRVQRPGRIQGKPRIKLILGALPATVSELARLCGATVAQVTGTLCWMRDHGLVKRSELRGERAGGLGRVPRYWIKVEGHA